MTFLRLDKNKGLNLESIDDGFATLAQIQLVKKSPRTYPLLIAASRAAVRTAADFPDFPYPEIQGKCLLGRPPIPRNHHPW